MAQEITRPRVDRKARLQIPPQDLIKQDPALRQCNWNEVVIGFEDSQAAIEEATRCIQCPDAPCIKACPVQNDIPGALWEIEQGNYIEAANIFRITSTMPEVCGRVCPQERLCEGSCVVGHVKKVPPNPPVAIGRLEAFTTDYQRTTEGFPMPPKAAATGHKIAIIGAGPAGLTVAEHVTVAGNQAVVYDSWPTPGGILYYGIPNFKLDKDIVNEKLSYLEALGVQFLCNTTLGKDITVESLLEEGYAAVYLGHGAGVARTMNIPGEDLTGIYPATEFLVRCNLPAEDLPEKLSKPVQVRKRVVVIGGGDTSMDCVRTAVRRAQEQNVDATVTCLIRTIEEGLPGRAAERQHALEEGVQFEYLTAATRFVPDADGRVSSIECVKTELGDQDPSDPTHVPTPIAGSEFVIEADTVVIAVGYQGDDALVESAGVEHNDGRIAIDPETGITSRPGVFAGGDSVRGADLVVTAVAQARIAAEGILNYLKEKTPVTQ